MDKVKTTTIIAIAVLVIAVASLGVTIYLNKDKFKKPDSNNPTDKSTESKN